MRPAIGRPMGRKRNERAGATKSTRPEPPRLRFFRWEVCGGGELQDIADTMPEDYSAAEQQARRAMPKQHRHNVPVPAPIG